MHLPLLSIVMPSLNQARFIEAAIASVLGQDYPNLELIVADGGSTDGTVELLQRLAALESRLRWHSEPDSGPANALNKALTRVRGTVVGWLNSDDLYTPGALQRAMTAFAANPDWLLLYGHGEHVDVHGQSSVLYPTLPPSTAIASFRQGCFICQPTVFFVRTVPMLLGKWDESLQCGFDFDYWLRAFKTFPGRIGFVDALQAQSRLHEGCITLKQRHRVAFEGMQVLHRHLGEAPGVWVETYLEELLSGTAVPEAGQTRRQAVQGLLESAQPLLPAMEYQRVAERIAGESRLDVPVTVPATIDPRTLIASYTLDQHVKLANDYFAGREGHWYLYQKPFFHPQDCAPMLGNLGDLFAGLKLSAGMQVLEFAAGSGWLSRYLVQLGCRVISSDASETALTIGKELFRRFPPIGEGLTEPTFLKFDGVHLDVPSASIDRIIVNDAFHHLPNTRIILAEFARVLKQDGIVGMSEPGRFHSQTEASQYEMRTFQVLENDVVLEELWQEAKAAGFADIAICPILRAAHLSMQEYLACINGSVPAKVSQSVKEGTTNQSIFFLYKAGKEDPARAANGFAANKEEFDADWYLAQYPDIADAIKKGFIADAWTHYEKFGRKEGRLGFPPK